MSQLLARLGSHLIRAAEVNAAPHAGIDDRIDGILERWKDETSAGIRRDDGVREPSASEEVHERLEAAGAVALERCGAILDERVLAATAATPGAGAVS